MATMTNHNSKFDTLILIDNGLVLKYRKRNEIKISYSELNKVYIDKHKLHPFFEFFCIAIPFLLVLVSIQYLPFYPIIILSLITIPLAFIRVLNYKWYQLNICLKNGVLYRKKVSLNKKAENFSLIHKVQKEFSYYNLNAL
jgi:hypothetical protein